MSSIWKDPFWTNPDDPHFSAASKASTENPTRPFYFVQNPAYSQVLQENVWSKALNRIVVNGISSEQAADEAMTRIQQIFDR